MEPLLCGRLYVWVSRFGQHFARDRCVCHVLGDVLWQQGPWRSSWRWSLRYKSAGVWSPRSFSALWWRAGTGSVLHTWCSYKCRSGAAPQHKCTMVYNTVIAASVRAGVDAAYLRF